MNADKVTQTKKEAAHVAVNFYNIYINLYLSDNIK